MSRLGTVVVVLLVTGLLATPAAVAQTVAPSATPPAQTTLTVEQIKDFLQHAKVVKVRNTNKGVTAPRRLTPPSPSPSASSQLSTQKNAVRPARHAW